MITKDINSKAKSERFFALCFLTDCKNNSEKLSNEKGLKMKKSATKKISKKSKITPEITPENPIVETPEIALKELLLSALSNNSFVMPFFSEDMFYTLLLEGKIKNIPTSNRVSNYESLPFIMPYDSEYKQRGFAGSRGRVFFSIATDKTPLDLIEFDLTNRQLENRQLRKRNIKRKIQAIGKAYFPIVNIKEKYPIAMFKDSPQ